MVARLFAELVLAGVLMARRQKPESGVVEDPVDDARIAAIR